MNDINNVKRVLFKETKGNGRKVQIWVFIEPNEFEMFGVVRKWQICTDSNIVSMTDGCRTFANAIDKFYHLISNIPIKQMITQETHYCVKFYDMNDTKAYIKDYGDIREIFIDLYTRKYPDESRNSANRIYRNCAQNVIDDTFAWGRENNLI